MAADVIRVRVAAVLVVRRDHVRSELAHEAHERLRCHLERKVGEAALRQRRTRVSLGVSGVLETQPRVVDPQDRRGLGHLASAHLGDPQRVDIGLGRGVEHITALAPGARDDEHLHALLGVVSEGRCALARLVVGMRVDRHEAQGWGHPASLPSDRRTRDARCPGQGVDMGGR